MKETLKEFVKKARQAGLTWEESSVQALQKGYKKASVTSVISRLRVQKGERQRAAGAGRHRLISSPEAQKMFGNLKSRHGEERARQLVKEMVRLVTVIEVPLTPGEIEDNPKYPEGAKERVLVNRYERNGKAIAACIEHYGRECRVCGMSFDDTYGGKAKHIIQVHHLVPLSKVGKAYNVDPIKDLLPVCPNCHSVIHPHKNVTLTPKEVQKMWAHQKRRGD